MASLPGEDQVYATLLLNDTYLPGALVLAHSLRDAGTSKQLVVLVTLDTVSAEVITELKAVYDHVIPVPRIRNARPANLYLMNRPDLHSAFTKVNLWRQTQFSKIVYIDADVVAYRAPDELFDIAAPFSAAPDIGWPDLFNTGVMVLTPNMGDYYALIAMAERGISFDGADQGLLNMHFKNTYNRISFTYNVTPSAHYQYVPAYRHFQSSINMVHFIGPDKPWFQGRQASKGDSPFEDMIGRWWAVYDRHYRVAETASTPAIQQQKYQDETSQHQQREQQIPEIVQYFTKGEFQPQSQATQAALTGEHHYGTQTPRNRGSPHYQTPPPSSAHEDYGSPHHNAHGPDSSQPHHHNELPYRDRDQKSQPEIAYQAGQSFPPPSESFSSFAGTQAEARSEQISAPQGRGPTPPPVEQTREPSPPPPPAWDAQRQPPPADSRPEALNFPSQTYEMSQDPAPFVPPERYPSPPKNMWYEVPKQKPTQKPRPLFPWEVNQPKPTRIFTADLAEPEAGESLSTPTGSSTTGQKAEPSTPSTPTIKVSPSDPWTTFTRTNAWDEVPEIERYVEGLQKHRRGKSQGSVGLSDEKAAKEHGLKLTDFPSVVERPSLPVTPAPIRRPKFWGGGPGTGDGDNEEELPVAYGVPPQSDWDPSAQLQKLAKQQSEALLKKLGGGEGGHEGSSGGVVLSPQPVKGSATTSALRSLSGDRTSSATTAVPPPAYQGSVTSWESGEGVSLRETPALPSNEQRDALDT